MRKKTLLLVGMITAIYLLLHLYRLSHFPVFADEAIYIRWAQLILDDPERYLFFAMNDGKTPLFIWLLTPFQIIFENPLFAGRFVSVVIGLLQVLALGWILKLLNVDRKFVFFGMIFTAILPFWFMYHRLALMDGLLVLGISIAYGGVLKTIKEFPEKKILLEYIQPSQYKKLASFFFNHSKLRAAILVTALGTALALWSKLPALIALPLLFLPSMAPQAISGKKYSAHKKLEIFSASFLGVFGGILLFSLLIFAPSFGQLFSRGGDFLYPLQEVLIGGLWKETVINIPTYINYFVSYLSPTLFVLIIMGLFAPKYKSRTHLLFWSGVLFILPIALLGKVVYPRYLFPAAFFFTIAAMSALDGIYKSWIVNNTDASSTKKTLIMSVIIALLIANSVITAAQFIQTHLSAPNNTPFVTSDIEQYLTKWSSGHGIIETSELIAEYSKDTTLAVATEGYFGTLPDGLLLYMHDSDVTNIYLEGIGQPVSELPADFISRAKDYEETWLVVNSHRLKIVLPDDRLVAEYCRPYAAPCLQVWDVTFLVK